MDSNAAAAVTAVATIALAAVGILSIISAGILAFFTYQLAAATVRLGNETERDRLDNLAPQATVLGFHVVEIPVQLPPDASHPEVMIEPATPWSLKQRGDVAIGLHAAATIVNEGQRTILVAVTTGPLVTAAVASVNKQGDQFVITPGQSAHLLLTRRRTMSDWVGDWQTSEGRPAPLGGWVTLHVVSQTTAAVKDEVQLEFGGYPFVPNSTNDPDSWVTGRTGQPGVPPPSVVRVGVWHRRYPTLAPVKQHRLGLGRRVRRE